MSNLNMMRLAFIVLPLLAVGFLTGCNADDDSVSAEPPTELRTGKDDPKSVAALKAINAETKTNESGHITFIDVSERDDISDDTFEHFSGLPQLKELHAIYTPITGNGLIHLSYSKLLETLDLYACPITDESLASIARWKRLRSLNLIGSKITDDSVEILSQFHDLEYLGIGSTQISESGRNKLTETLPDNCELD